MRRICDYRYLLVGQQICLTKYPRRLSRVSHTHTHVIHTHGHSNNFYFSAFGERALSAKVENSTTRLFDVTKSAHTPGPDEMRVCHHCHSAPRLCLCAHRQQLFFFVFFFFNIFFSCFSPLFNFDSNCALHRIETMQKRPRKFSQQAMRAALNGKEEEEEKKMAKNRMKTRTEDFEMKFKYFILPCADFE